MSWESKAVCPRCWRILRGPDRAPALNDPVGEDIEPHETCVFCGDIATLASGAIVPLKVWVEPDDAPRLLDPNCRHGFRGLYGTRCVSCGGSRPEHPVNKEVFRIHEGALVSHFSPERMLVRDERGVLRAVGHWPNAQALVDELEHELTSKHNALFLGATHVCEADCDSPRCPAKKDATLLERFYSHIYAGHDAVQARDRVRRDVAVLDAMTEFTEDDLRKSVGAASPDDPKREARLSYAVCAAELRRRGLEP